jgi:hypothetical protein
MQSFRDRKAEHAAADAERERLKRSGMASTQGQGRMVSVTCPPTTTRPRGPCCHDTPWDPLPEMTHVRPPRSSLDRPITERPASKKQTKKKRNRGEGSKRKRTSRRQKRSPSANAPGGQMWTSRPRRPSSR